VQHHKELESEPSQGKNWYADEDTICDLQCGDSLAIAADRIGEGANGGCFHVKASDPADAYFRRIHSCLTGRRCLPLVGLK
jgi:hypothetical protein